jgi:hypothetical protein
MTIMRLRTPLAISLLLTRPGAVFAQPEDRTALVEAIEKNGCATTPDSAVRACRADYSFEDRRLEALSFHPVAEGRYPGGPGDPRLSAHGP